MYTKPNKVKLSETTGYIYPIYLRIAKISKELNKIRICLEKTRPWADQDENSYPSEKDPALG